ncbi:MAG: permease-like cell division protein FtsX [bacterium]|nr:permease-like cell division protein FtsX [bacterium]
MKTLDTTWKHIRRSPYQSLAAVLTMFLTFLLTGIFFLTSASSIMVLRFFESKPQITVFFTDEATSDEIDGLKKTLEDTGKISSIRFISKDDALKVYQEQNKNDPLLLEMVTADILPASLEVSAKDPKFLRELEPVVKDAVHVEEVVYQQDVVETLLSWTNAVRMVGGVLGGLLAVDAILIVVTIISMKIALKKEEIDILKLVGAAPWYIRTPFILEGGIYGVVGACIAWITISGVVLWFRPFLLDFLGIIPIFQTVLANPESTVFLLSLFGFLGALLFSGFVLGSLGSLLALGRYLKF